MKKCIAEFIGTFTMVFCGTGAIVINQVSDGVVGHMGIAVTFGLIVMAMIYSFGAISGAHINPAVSIAFAATPHFDKRDLLPYIVSQVAGAFLASGLLKFLFAGQSNLGETLPAGTWQQSFVLEIILTFFLMLVILMVSQNKEVTSYTGIAVGATVLLEALFGGPISGASMNPARSLAPALFSGHMEYWWLYMVAPVMGALLGSAVYAFFAAAKKNDNI